MEVCRTSTGLGGRRLAAPTLTGIMLAAGTPPSLSPVIPFVALVPLAVHLARLPPERAGRHAFGAGALAAAIQHGWGLRWLHGTLVAIAGGFNGSATFALVLVAMAGIGGAAAWCVRALLNGPGRVPLAIALTSAWTAFEWGLAHLPLGLAFPWAPLGLALAAWPEALGALELVGVHGVTAWLALVNGLVAAAVVDATAVLKRYDSSRWRPALALGAAALLAVGPVVWGVWRSGTLDSPVQAQISVLTLDVSPTGAPLARARDAVAATEAALARMQGSPDLVVLPEMALPLDVDAPETRPLIDRLRTQAERLGAPVLAGVRAHDERGRPLNSAVLIGGTPFRADKRRLVPAAERGGPRFLPAWLAPAAGGYVPGRGWPVLEAGPLRAGVLICYEVAFSEDARRLVRDGAAGLLVISSDAWFGGLGRDAGIAQQIAHVKLRAIETRTGVARSANGGPAVVVDPSGRVRQVLSAQRRPADGAGIESPAAAALTTQLRAFAAPTLFVRTGDWVGPAAALALALTLVRGHRRRGQRVTAETL